MGWVWMFGLFYEYLHFLTEGHAWSIKQAVGEVVSVRKAAGILVPMWVIRNDGNCL